MDHEEFDKTIPNHNPTMPMAEEAGSQVNQVVSRAGELASETLEEAKKLGATARERLFSEADDKKVKVARKLYDLAENMELLGGEKDDLQQRLAGGAARTVRKVSHALEEKTTRELLASAGRAIKQRPGLFLAGCVALGFIGGRMLRR